MTEQGESKTEETKEVLIGKFKPKRKFLSFVSAVNGAKVRFIRDIAFIKGEKLSGILDKVVFKITICDEGTINFEEVDTNQCDEAMIQRFVTEIDETDVTGYAQKFVVVNFEFADIDGRRCYLEVEEKKPIDKLKALFDEEEKVEVSQKGMSILDQLFGDSEDEDTTETAQEVPDKEEVVKENIGVAASYLEESFRKMNENKVIELKSRIEDKGKEIARYQHEIGQSEKRLKESTEQLGVLETRLESMSPVTEPNGYVFFVSEEQKLETGLDENTKGIADKIADLMNLKKDVLFKYLTGGFYKLKIAKSDDIENKETKVDKDILEKLSSIDHLGKITQTGHGEFEYRGDLNWHQIVGKMLKQGFLQDPAFDKLSLSNSYESKEEVVKEKHSCSHDNCGCESEDKSVDKVDEVVEKTDTNDTSDDTKLITVNSYLNPTDLVVVGMHLGDTNIGHDFDFSITDDYSSFRVKIGSKMKSQLESDGFGSIITLSDFIKIKDKVIADDWLGVIDAYIIPKFKGDIKVGGVDRNGNFIKIDSVDEILHQKDSIYDVVLVLPEGNEIVQITSDNIDNVITQYTRDSKITTILDNKDKKEYVIIGENDSSDWDILSEWYLKANQTKNELREYALNNFCMTLDKATKIKETPEIKNEGSQYKTVKIIHIDEVLDLMTKNGSI